MGKQDPVAIRKPSHEKECLDYAALLQSALMFPSLETGGWLERYDRDTMHFGFVGDELVAGLVALPMGQYFAGRPVPTVGIHSVAVAPQMRGRGVGATLMKHVLRAIHESGVPLSTLYPATQPLYRSVGYEQAGHRVLYRVPLRLVDRHQSTAEIRKATDADHESMRALYGDHAARTPGHVQRAVWGWRQVFEPVGLDVESYVAHEGDQMTGYVVVSRRPRKGGHYDLLVWDMVVRTRQALAAVRRILANHRQIGQDLLWWGGPVDAMTLSFSEQDFAVDTRMRWMLRIIDVAKALTQRGYAQGWQGELHLEIRDELLPVNNRRFVLAVSAGQASVRLGGRGLVQLDVRGLAALYSGYATTLQLSLAGLATGEEAELNRADHFFAGPAPWMPEMF